MSRHLERLLQIDALLRSRLRHTAISLAKELEVSERTIRNDLAFLRDRYDAPLQAAQRMRGSNLLPSGVTLPLGFHSTSEKPAPALPLEFPVRSGRPQYHRCHLPYVTWLERLKTHQIAARI
ncbi:MAG TPA: HTH domain-containing protein [Coleofasciculaceae cyanobacterium]